MSVYDCFNGDADGICALTQLRLNKPQDSVLITGVKRDINLLKRVHAVQGDEINVLDISLDKNRADVIRCLQEGAEVFYCDHHYAGEIPSDKKLTALINTTPDVCTSLLINQYLQGKYLDWAVAGTFGDNLRKRASAMAKSLHLNQKQLGQLESLGVYLNYNGYGSEVEDLHFHPKDLFLQTSQCDSAFGFIHECRDTYAVLEDGYHDDMARAIGVKPVYNQLHAKVFMLPNAAWSRRVSGIFGNDLANRSPQTAHAVVTEKQGGGYVVSVRAPLSNKHGADRVCRQFESGGGRAAAAGINWLPKVDLESFIKVFSEFYSN
jgi:single-stranded DNA-specific DHH superfamily exonuclease